MGVDHRILQLSDRDEGAAAMPESGRPYESLVPLPEVISACVGFSTASKKVQGRYEMLLKETWGRIFHIKRGATGGYQDSWRRGSGRRNPAAACRRSCAKTWL